MSKLLNARLLLADTYLKLALDLAAVLSDQGGITALVGVEGAPGGAAGADDVLVGNGKEVALLNGEALMVGVPAESLDEKL